MMPSKPVKPVYTRDICGFISQTAQLLGSAKVVLLCDEHTLAHCLPLANLTYNHTIVLLPGEQEKSLQTAENIWKLLARWDISGNDLLVCMGGGVICDLGAFCASVFKRGIPFLLVPTSLLAMTDAAIGGKTAVNLGELKNYIGTIAFPAAVLCNIRMLQTLPAKELREGWAEMLKHGLVVDASLYNMIAGMEMTGIPPLPLLKRSAACKLNIVKQDAYEKGKRKLLNFGHTIGHALESHFLSGKSPISHGTAIAAGMWMETRISIEKSLLEPGTGATICTTIDRLFEPVRLLPDDIPQIVAMCRFDKKNRNEQLLFTLLNSIGEGVWDQKVTESEIWQALETYCQCHP